MKAWVPTHKTSTKPSISQQNEKPLLPSAFLKCEGFLSGTGNVYSLAIEHAAIKTNQTYIHISTDRCLLFSPEQNRIHKWHSALFKSFVVCLNVIYSQDLLFVLLLFSHYQNQNWVVFA